MTNLDKIQAMFNKMDKKQEYDRQTKNDCAEKIFAVSNLENFQYDYSLPQNGVNFYCKEFEIKDSYRNFVFHFVFLYTSELDGYSMGDYFPITVHGLEIYKRIVEHREQI